MVTDLVEIRQFGSAKKAENLEFRRFLAARHRPIEPLQKLAEEIQHHMDCTACANCYRYSVVNVSPSEIDTRYLRIRRSSEDLP